MKRRATRLSLLGLLLSLLLTTTEVVCAEENPRPPLSVIEKNKKVTAAKQGDSGPIPGISTRVVGGKQVTSKSKAKWFVEWADSSCGGSLIHDDIVLTAAHCESTFSPFNTRLYVNGIKSREGVFRTVEKQVSHPLYKVEANNDYDVMLLKLHTSALVDEKNKKTGAETIVLNTKRDIPKPGDTLLALGYGFTKEGGESSKVLNDVEVKYMNESECLQQYGSTTFAKDIMFCAGVEGGGKDTCQGDSGGPIIDLSTHSQVGVVSFGVGCARETHYGVYARVSAVTDWIKKQICDLSQHAPSDCPAKEVVPGVGEGLGNISIAVTYDGYPRETAYSLVHDGSGVQLYFQPYDAPNAKYMGTETHQFDNLPAGNYTLMLGDDGRDGFCCAYGNGSLVLTDTSSGDVVWEVPKKWGEYIEATFSIDEHGLVTLLGNTSDYLNSWELSPEPPNNPATLDQMWPGPYPSSPNDFYINIRYDRFPKETTWEFSPT